MLDSADATLRGTWGWGAPTGWGKSTGLCSFLRGAGSLYMLGHQGGSWDHRTNVSAIITAARIESLYELERQMTDTTSRFPIPPDRIMVLHSDTSGHFRPSDEGKDAPICLVAHNKLKHIAKRPTADQQQFLSYRGQVRDICIVDEAFNEAEASYVDQGFLSDAMRALLDNLARHPDTADFTPLVEVIQPMFEAIERENARQEKLDRLERSEGMVQSPALTEGDIKELETLVRRVRLVRDQRNLLLKFLKMVPSPLRLIRGRQSGVVTVINTMPPVLTNRIELNASFEIGMLSALDPTVKNADDHFPMLQELKSTYNLPTGLSGIIDYSDMTITHLQRGGGKSTMAAHLEDIRNQTASTRKVMDFYVEAIKATPQNEGVLVLTYLEDGVDYVEALTQVFRKAGIDMDQTVLDDTGKPVPRIAFTTYGAHLSTNRFRHCSTGILAGVQQRHKAEIAGSMCGMRKSLAAPVDFAEVDIVHQAVAGADAQQGIGRLRCRMVERVRPSRSVSISPTWTRRISSSRRDSFERSHERRGSTRLQRIGRRPVRPEGF
jgi:hypothetical protein